MNVSSLEEEKLFWEVAEVSIKKQTKKPPAPVQTVKTNGRFVMIIMIMILFVNGAESKDHY